MERLIINDRIKKSRIPARLDLAQSGTGLILGLFMWVHMFLVASILLGKGSFNFVAKTMELSFLSSTGQGYPLAVFVAVSGVFTLFILHAALGVRKFPISFRQHAILTNQMGILNHEDTRLWYVQFITGFVMFFLGSVHLYVMLTHPGQIDPYLSADRFVSSGMWPLYLVLLVAVELHGTIGLYRLCMKWGWLSGKDARQSRQKLKRLKERITIFFLGLGGLAFLVFVVIGISHRDRAGEPYAPRHAAVQAPAATTTEHAPAPVVKQAPGAAAGQTPAVQEPKQVPESAPAHSSTQTPSHSEAVKAPAPAPVHADTAPHGAVIKPDAHAPAPPAHTTAEPAPAALHGESAAAQPGAQAAEHAAEAGTQAAEGAGHGEAKPQHKE